MKVPVANAVHVWGTHSSHPRHSEVRQRQLFWLGVLRNTAVAAIRAAALVAWVTAAKFLADLAWFNIFFDTSFDEEGTRLMLILAGMLVIVISACILKGLHQVITELDRMDALSRYR